MQSWTVAIAPVNQPVLLSLLSEEIPVFLRMFQLWAGLKWIRVY